jgi:RNA polymerase sigma factor (sigma-70 family)
MSTAESEFLHDYVATGSQAAFSALVTRHVDLVYSAALRQVRSPELAEEITQNTFVVLARTAQRLKPGTPLVAWLYLVTRRAAIDALRAEARRQTREHVAAEMSSMNSRSPDWSRIEPMLDDAMETLGDKDRSAILLRFFEGKSLREIGAALGTSEDAAQKRVSRALEQLRGFLLRRGVVVGAGSLATSLSAHAVQAAPIGLALSISATSAITGAVAVHAVAGSATQFFVMTTLHKTLLTTTIALAVGVGIYEHRVISSQEQQLADARQEIERLREQAQQIRQERDATAARWAAMQTEIDAASAKIAREGVGPASATTAADGEMKAVLDRVAELKRRIAEIPGARARAAGMLKREDWIKIALDNRLDTEADIKKALDAVQDQVKVTWGNQAQKALRDFARANGGMLPTDSGQLAAFLPAGSDPAILPRFQMLRSGNLNDLSPQAWLAADIGPVDDEDESIMLFGRGDVMWGTNNGVRRAALRAYVEFARAHNGQLPSEAAQLQPYLRQPIEPALLQDFWRQYGHQLR